MFKEKFEKIKEEYKINLDELKEEYEKLYDKVSSFECLVEKTNEEYFEYIKSTIDPKLIVKNVDTHKIHIVDKNEFLSTLYDQYLTMYKFTVHEEFGNFVIGTYKYSSNNLNYKLLPRNCDDRQFDWNISDGLKELFEGDRDYDD